jgi:hypothetical protein
MLKVLCYLIVIALAVVSTWRVYVKADQPGWASIVPIYNLYILCKIAGKSGWWVLLSMIPFVGIVILVILNLELSKSFGKGTGFGLGLSFLPIIFYPILAFGDAEYEGPSTPPAATSGSGVRSASRPPAGYPRPGSAAASR